MCDRERTSRLSDNERQCRIESLADQLSDLHLLDVQIISDGLLLQVMEYRLLRRPRAIVRGQDSVTLSPEAKSYHIQKILDEFGPPALDGQDC